LLYEALAPLNALVPSSLTAEALADAIAQVAATALKQQPPDGMSMAQWFGLCEGTNRSSGLRLGS